MKETGVILVQTIFEELNAGLKANLHLVFELWGTKISPILALCAPKYMGKCSLALFESLKLHLVWQLFENDLSSSIVVKLYIDYVS